MPSPPCRSFLLPTFSCSFPMANFPHQRQVIEALEPAPERDRTGFAIAVARQKAAQLCRPPDELAHRGRFSRRTALAKSHTPQRLPLRFAEPITGGCIRHPPPGFAHGQPPPRDHPTPPQHPMHATRRGQLPLLDLTTAFENLVHHFNLPTQEIG